MSRADDLQLPAEVEARPAFAIVATAPDVCSVCRGEQRTGFLGIDPAGDWIEWTCWHCSTPHTIPLLHVPWYQDRLVDQPSGGCQ